MNTVIVAAQTCLKKKTLENTTLGSKPNFAHLPR